MNQGSTQRIKKWCSIWLLFWLMSFYAHLANADLILSAPPREPAKAGQQLYGPLAKRLSDVLGEKVIYQHPRNWLAYQHDMRADKYDIIFDGPHFISWRMKNKGHMPAVKLPGKLQFYIVTKADNDKVKKPSDLVGRRICGIAPPNLGTLTVYAAYPHPARQPVIVPIKGGMIKVFKAFEKGRCDAAVLRTKVLDKKLSDEQRKSVKIIHTSEAMTNQGISVSKRVNAKARAAIIAVLTKGDRIPASKGILKRFGGKAKAFLPATRKNYEGYHKLIQGVIFGW